MRTILPEDVYNFRFVHDPAISNDGKAILFTLTQANGENDYSSAIWKYSSGRLDPIISNSGRASNPVWSPRGQHFLFVSTKSEVGRSSSQLWVAEQNGLNRRKLVEFERSISDPKWSSDGKYIFFISDHETDSGPRGDVRIVTRMNYRFDGQGYFENRRPHVFKVSVGSLKLEQLTLGEFDVSAFDISPDGKTIAFVSNLDKDADFQNNMDIYTISSSGGVPKKLLSMKGSIVSLSYSRDGRFLGFIADDYRFRFNTPVEVWLYDFKTKTIRNLSRKLNRPARNSIVSDVVMDKAAVPLAWGETNGKEEIYFVTTDQGSCNVYAIDPAISKFRQVTSGKSVVTNFSVAKDGTMAFVRMDPTHLPEIYLVSKQGPPLRVTEFNGEFLSSISLSSPMDFRFNAKDGVAIHGFLLMPSNLGEKGRIDEKGKNKFPCVVEIHGGGGTEGFQFAHEFQCLAAKGFAVLTCNFRGTQGYGEKFVKVLTGHYMEKDYSDIIDMVTYALQQGWVDKNKLGVTGGSYGGYLTNWTIGHSKLFAAAVTDRSVVNLFSFYGTSDDYRLIEEDVQMSFPWDRPDQYLAQSPISYTKNITTPLLIMHADQDFRCRLEQAEQLYAFLKRQGKEVQFIIFPGESHGLSRGGKPHHRVERLQFMLWWFTSHIDSGELVSPPL